MNEAPAADLTEIVRAGRERFGTLFTAGELALLERVLALPVGPLSLYARLTARVRPAFQLESLIADYGEVVTVQLALLEEQELVDTFVPWSVRAECSTRGELAAGCRALGLPASGSLEDLRMRLRGRSGWCPGRWVRTRHLGLIRRLERWYFLRLDPDRSDFVVERLGHRRWVPHPVTGGMIHFNRGHLVEWERRLGRLSSDDVQELSQWLTEQGWDAPGRLALVPRVREALLRHVQRCEAAGDLENAEKQLRLLILWTPTAEVALRLARVQERRGAAHDAWSTLRSALERSEGPDRLALIRSGRRMGASLRLGWIPDLPLRRPPERRLRLREAAKSGVRPLWWAGERGVLVEDAAIQTLRTSGRSAFFAEGSLWTTLFGILYADVIFSRVAGAFPAARMTAPLDWGGPTFRDRRAVAIQDLEHRIFDGHAASLLQENWHRFNRMSITGVSWDRFTEQQLVKVVTAMPVGALIYVFSAISRSGRRAAHGLPDLFIEEGPAVCLSGAWPTRVPASPMLVEVKGPTDRMHDAQLWWADRLLGAGVLYEIWRIEAAHA